MGLILKKPLTLSTEEFRVISVNRTTQHIALLGQYTSLEQAKELAHQTKEEGLDIYIQGEHNRVVYRV